MKRVLLSLSLLSAAIAGVGNETARAGESISNAHELVIAGHPVSTQAGLDVLHAGGNAADALIAVSLSLGVTEPGNSGLGGKMVLQYYDAKTKTVTCVVAMSAGPLHGTAEGYKALPAIEQDQGWKAVCIPGIASALGEIQKRWASRSFAELCQPAIHQAEDGVTIIPTAAEMFKDFKPKIDASADALYAPGGKTLAVGTHFTNPDLAHTLHILADKGPQAFYEGEIAQKFVDASKKAGGFLEMDDFTSYHARVLEPLKGTFANYTVYSSPPPLDGGCTVLTALECMDKMDWTGATPRNAKYIDTFSRVLQQVYPLENRNAGDTADSRQRVDANLKPEAIEQITASAKAADPHVPYEKKKAALAKPAGLSPELFADANDYDSDHTSTTHLVIIDKAGDIACCTQSLGLHFGSKVVATGTGVLLNADIDNFAFGSAKGVNYFAPGKFPRSTMSPTIFMKDDKPFLVIGSPAAARIPNMVLQVALDVLKFNVPLKEAIEAPRFHIIAGGTPRDAANHIDFESAMPAGLEDSLDALGWKSKRGEPMRFYFGSVNAALIQDGKIEGVADQRRTADAGGD